MAFCELGHVALWKIFLKIKKKQNKTNKNSNHFRTFVELFLFFC